MKLTATRAVIAGAAALLLALTGCSSTPSTSGENTPSPTGNKTSAAPQNDLLASVETMFGTVDIPQPADGELTVVSLGWSDAETLLALGVTPVAVQDWLGFGEENSGVGPWAGDKLGGANIAIIPANYEGVDYDLIDSYKPDLILNVRSDNNEETFTQLSKIAPTVYGPVGAPAFATSWRDQTQMIADAVGKSAEGKQLIADVEKQLEQAAAANPNFADLTAVTGTKFGDAYGAYLPGDFRWDLLAEVGFTLNPAVSELETAGFYAPVSLEQVTAFDADVAFFFPIGYTLAELQGDPLLSSLQVVKDGRAVFIDGLDVNMQAFSAASILSIPRAIDSIVPLLAQAAGNAG